MISVEGLPAFHKQISHQGAADFKLGRSAGSAS